MIPREEHIKQINRLHDKIDELDQQFKAAEGDKDQQGEIALKHFKLVQIWNKTDNSIERIKDALDQLQIEENHKIKES